MLNSITFNFVQYKVNLVLGCPMTYEVGQGHQNCSQLTKRAHLFARFAKAKSIFIISLDTH